jgi:hypothetical protein
VAETGGGEYFCIVLIILYMFQNSRNIKINISPPPTPPSNFVYGWGRVVSFSFEIVP